jgi:hypothetical protein
VWIKDGTIAKVLNEWVRERELAYPEGGIIEINTVIDSRIYSRVGLNCI